MAHPLLTEAKRQAEKLSRYVIKSAPQGVILWRYAGGWMAVHHFPSEEAAEDYLFNKLPAIESEL